MHWIQAVSLPVIGALIGWLTNWLAVRLLFRPYKPYRIPLIGYNLQGMLPKYRCELAKSIGNVVQKDLLPVDRLVGHLRSREFSEEVIQYIDQAIRHRVMDRLPAFLPLSIKRPIADALGEQVYKELPVILNELVERFGNKIKENLELARMVESKLNEFPLEQLEAITIMVAGRELRHIEVFGGVLGFLIGLVQVILLYLLR